VGLKLGFKHRLDTLHVGLSVTAQICACWCWYACMLHP
jgi:hypothetical protein